MFAHIEGWWSVLHAYDLIRHRVQFGYWPNHNNRSIVVPRSARVDLLWLASRT